METTLTVLHYIVCTLLIGLVMMQAGKGANIGAAFGGGSSQTVFGGRGPATFLSKATTIMAVIFFVTSISLAHLSKQGEIKTVVDSVPISETIPEVESPAETAPATDEAAPGSTPDKK